MRNKPPLQRSIGGTMKIWAVVLMVALTLFSAYAEAARPLAGSKSAGQPSSNATQGEASPTAPAAKASGAVNAAPISAMSGPASVAPKRPWAAVMAGLAAGLGLAWLAHTLGLGDGLGLLLVFVLVLFALVMGLAWLKRRRRAAVHPTRQFAFQGASANMAFAESKPYRPENVGNDASARPWERNSMAFEVATAAAAPSIAGSGPRLGPPWSVPEGFDSAGFLATAKTNFVALQVAWDQSNIAALRAMMTDAMLKEIQAQLLEREAQPGANPNRTDVVMLEARLLGIEEAGEEYLASVEFSGMIREEPSAGPSPFREVWNMSKPVQGNRGWLVAGVQALQ